MRDLNAPRRFTRGKLVSFALTEASAGSDVGAHQTTLHKNEDGTYRLEGGKIWITNAAWAGSIVAVAKCPDLTPIPGGSVFVYLKPDDPGVRRSSTSSRSPARAGVAGNMRNAPAPTHLNRVSQTSVEEHHPAKTIWLQSSGKALCVG